LPPASWENIAVFFIGNYLSHAATVKLPPATTMLTNAGICFSALVMPATGLVFGLGALSQAHKGYKEDSELKKVALASALCMYVRTAEWNSDGRVSAVEAKVSTPEHIEPSLLNWWFIQAYRSSKKNKQHFLIHFTSFIAILLVHVAVALDRTGRTVFRMMYDIDQENQGMDMEATHTRPADIEMQEM
jgi:hypothetical protein